jgi:hypothetical protein
MVDRMRGIVSAYRKGRIVRNKTGAHEVSNEGPRGGVVKGEKQRIVHGGIGNERNLSFVPFQPSLASIQNETTNLYAPAVTGIQ